MPRREVSGNGLFTDHWIRKPDQATKLGGAIRKPAREPDQVEVQSR
jgi:hypothetical protein